MKEKKAMNLPAKDDSHLNDAILLLNKILQFYKQVGPQSMESLTKSYLSSAPTVETAKDAS
jgi:hypothetical protein